MSRKPSAPAAPAVAETEPAPRPPSKGMVTALAALLDAQEAAAEHKLDEWQFAVSLAALNQVGARETDLRRLLAGALAEHRCETTRGRDRRRSFGRGDSLALTAASCFVLTGAGRRLLECVVLRPRWDRDRREFWVGDVLVKVFRRLATNQEVILSAFEDDGWPPRIDDPLPPVHGLLQRERLHWAVRKLNRGQGAVRFRRDGTGEGVTWSIQPRFRGRAVVRANENEKAAAASLFVMSA